MVVPNITFPMRPTKVSPPGSSVFSQFRAVLWSAIIAGGALLVVIPPIPDLVSDFAVRGAARPIADATIEGKCSVYLLLASCEATLSARRPGLPELRRTVDYWFVDFRLGKYTAAVVADPARPEKMTTDLALDKLWNRTATLLLLGPLLLWLGFFVVKYVSGALLARRAAVRALSNQVLRATLLRLDSWNNDTWTVSSLTPTGAGKSCEWETKGTPIFMDQTQNLVLGVTAGDGTECMPLDTTLSWIDLTDHGSHSERRLRRSCDTAVPARNSRLQQPQARLTLACGQETAEAEQTHEQNRGRRRLRHRSGAHRQ